MNPAIQEYIDNIKQDWQIDVCKKLVETVNEAIPDMEDRIQYCKPHFLKNGKYAAVFGTAKGWVSFTIFNATTLQQPDDLFEASDNNDRITIKIKEGQDVDYDLLTSLLKQASDTIE